MSKMINKKNRNSVLENLKLLNEMINYNILQTKLFLKNKCKYGSRNSSCI